MNEGKSLPVQMSREICAEHLRCRIRYIMMDSVVLQYWDIYTVSSDAESLLCFEANIQRVA